MSIYDDWNSPHVIVARDYPTVIYNEEPLPVSKEHVTQFIPEVEPEDETDDETEVEPQDDRDRGVIKPMVDIAAGIDPDLETKVRQIIYGDTKKKPFYNSKIDYAIFASNVYKKRDQRVSDLSKYTNRATYLPVDSNDENSVYKMNDGKYVISMRGSATASDWILSDSTILAGDLTKSARFKRTNEFVNNIVNKYNIKPKDLTLVGHSLGASLAASVNASNGSKYNSIGFNPGVSPTMLQNDRFIKSGDYVNSNMINFVVSGDPISASSAILPNYVRSVNIKGRGNPIKRHSIDQFITAIGDYSDREDRDLFGRPVSEAGIVVVPPNFEDIPTHEGKSDSPDDRPVLPIPPLPLIPGIKQDQPEPIEVEPEYPTLDLGEPEPIELEPMLGVAEEEADILGTIESGLQTVSEGIAGGLEEIGVSEGVASVIAEGLELGLGFL
jgi:hypothetical protein